MSDAVSIVKKLVPDTVTKDVEIETYSGEKVTFTIRRFYSIGDYDRVAQAIEKRKGALAMHKGKLPIVCNESDVSEFANILSDLEIKDGKAIFYLTTEREVEAATQIEQCVESPKLTWWESALLVRTSGTVVAKILEEFAKFNKLEPLEEAKND